MPNPTASIMAQASTAQLKEYLLGFTAEAAVLALDELIRRGYRHRRIDEKVSSKK